MILSYLLLPSHHTTTLNENELLLGGRALLQLFGRHAHPLATAGRQRQTGEPGAPTGQTLPAAPEFGLSLVLVVRFPLGVAVVVLDGVVGDFGGRRRSGGRRVLVQGLQVTPHHDTVSLGQRAVRFVPVASLGGLNYFILYAVPGMGGRRKINLKKNVSRWKIVS